jgi:predicted secreted hydrolase
VKRIEKKSLPTSTAPQPARISMIVIKQVLDGVPMVKATIDWNNSGRPEFLANAFITIKNGAETIHTNLPANTPTVPNEDPATWQDYFGWWYATGNAQDAEVEDMPVEIEP